MQIYMYGTVFQVCSDFSKKLVYLRRNSFLFHASCFIIYYKQNLTTNVKYVNPDPIQFYISKLSLRPALNKVTRSICNCVRFLQQIL